MPVWGDTLEEWAARISPLAPGGTRDWSIDLAYYLGMAYVAAQKMIESGANLKIQERQLIIDQLSHAWRELLHVRLKLQRDIALVDTDNRPFTLSRTGRIIDNHADKTGLPALQRYYSNTHVATRRLKRDAHASRKVRRGHRTG